MGRRIRSESGFTLVELMMSVALIGVMAAIAIPSFQTFQARSRRSEASVNLSAIGRSYKTYYAEEGSFPDMLNEKGEPVFPTGAPSTVKQQWPAEAKDFFNIVGYDPEGPVYYTYGVNADCGVCTDCFTAFAIGDVDGDGGQGGVIYVHPDANGLTCPTTLYSWTEPPGVLDEPAPITPGVGSPPADNF